MWTSRVEQVNSLTTATQSLELDPAISGMYLEKLDRATFESVYKGRAPSVNALKIKALRAERLLAVTMAERLCIRCDSICRSLNTA